VFPGCSIAQGGEASLDIFGFGKMAMSDEQRAGDGHLREIAEKIRELARQTDIPEVQEDLFDLADRLDRIEKGPDGARG